MLEDPFYDEEEARDVRAHWRRLAVRLVVGAVIVFALGGAMRKVFAADGLAARIDCQRLGGLIMGYADFRDTGAKLDLVLKMARERFPDPPWAKEVLAREIRRMWRERLAGEDAAGEVFKRCEAQLGYMGREL